MGRGVADHELRRTLNLQPQDRYFVTLKHAETAGLISDAAFETDPKVAARLNALASYEILDTPPEPEFDDIVNVAQKIADTPVALVSLVDLNRQWFKARVGFAACETSINDSVCAHALKEDDLLVIPDLLLDPRTKTNSFVTGEPHIRFYAGTVLRTPEGVPFGTLCVIDTEPRPQGLTFEQADALRALGRQTMVVMGMRRAVNVRVEALVLERDTRRAKAEEARALQVESERVQLDEARSRLAQQAGGIGTFDVEVATDRCFVSAEFCRIFGLPNDPEFVMSDLQKLIHEEDLETASNRLSRADGTAPPDIEFRIRRAHDGSVRWIGRRSVFHADDNGVVRRMIGVVQDITERKNVEVRRLALIQLGDDLRDAPTSLEVMEATGRTIGMTLNVDRAGYCTIHMTSETLTVEYDWRSQGTKSIAGRNPMGSFGETLSRLEAGSPIVVANVPAADWMAKDSAWYDQVGTRAKIIVPVSDHGKLVGLVYAYSAVPRTWTAAEVDFVQAVADRGFAVLAKIQAEQHQHLLNQELSHRLKNTLSMVQAIASQTLRQVQDKEALSAFEERIIALSRAHDVLLQQNWSAARIDTVIANVLSLHGGGNRVVAEGPNLTLGPKATLSLSLLLHELATNALKYGALSRPEGRIVLVWKVVESESGPTLVVTWREGGGPAAKAPTRLGFGTRLISMGIAGTGNAALDYGETGLIAEFRALLSKIAEN